MSPWPRRTVRPVAIPLFGGPCDGDIYDAVGPPAAAIAAADARYVLIYVEHPDQRITPCYVLDTIYQWHRTQRPQLDGIA